MEHFLPKMLQRTQLAKKAIVQFMLQDNGTCKTDLNLRTGDPILVDRILIHQASEMADVIEV
jgi:hypothetical protein